MIHTVARGVYLQCMQSSTVKLKAEVSRDGKYWKLLESLIDSEVEFRELDSLDEIFLDDEVSEICAEMFERELDPFPEELESFAYKYSKLIAEKSDDESDSE